MKILTWNCNLAFRKKYEHILEYDPDICVIEECENPELYPNEYGDFAQNYIWTGDNKNKGLGIFAKPDIKIEKQTWTLGDFLRYFIIARVNDSFDLVAVWTMDGYIPTFAALQEVNLDKFNNTLVLAGDFNSNKIFDGTYGGPRNNHSAIIKKLADFGLDSSYHHYFNEEQGQESRATYFQYRKADDKNKFHLDYIFCDQKRVNKFEIGDESWLEYSDHVPLYVDID